MLQFMGSQTVRYNLVTEQQVQILQEILLMATSTIHGALSWGLGVHPGGKVKAQRFLSLKVMGTAWHQPVHLAACCLCPGDGFCPHCSLF